LLSLPGMPGCSLIAGELSCQRANRQFLTTIFFRRRGDAIGLRVRRAGPIRQSA
jgi:hypothetical protein